MGPAGNGLSFWPLLRWTTREEAREAQGVDAAGCDPACRRDGVPVNATDKGFFALHDGAAFFTGCAATACPIWMWIVVARWLEPTAGITDSQSIKTPEVNGPCGYDAGRKIAERKRHIATDTFGNMFEGVVHAIGVRSLSRCWTEGI